MQGDDEGREYAVSFASKSCNPAERNYKSYDRECVVVVWGVVHFREYMFGQNLTIQTDHHPLKWLMTTSKLRGSSQGEDMQ